MEQKTYCEKKNEFDARIPNNDTKKNQPISLKIRSKQLKFNYKVRCQNIKRCNVHSFVVNLK